eukprot:jgi/Mesvir1/12203/Mv26375-RA.1
MTSSIAPELKGKLAWYGSICGPDMMVHSRSPDDVLILEEPSQIIAHVNKSPGITLAGIDLSLPFSLDIYVDSSMDSRQLVSKVRGRSAGLFVLQQHRPSLVAWYSCLQRRVAVSSDVSE